MTINFHSVQWLKFYYTNQFGETVTKKPKGPSVHKQLISDRGRLELATSRGLLDHWTPTAKFQFRGGETVELSGPDAVKKKDAFNSFVFGRGK